MARFSPQQRFQNTLETVAERPAPCTLNMPTSTPAATATVSKSPLASTPHSPWAPLDSPTLGRIPYVDQQSPSGSRNVDAYLASSRCQMPPIKSVTPLDIKKLRRRGMSTDVALSLPAEIETRPMLQLSIPSPSELLSAPSSSSSSSTAALAGLSSVTSPCSPSEEPSPGTVNALSHLAHLALPTPASGTLEKSPFLTVPSAQSSGTPPQSALTFTAEWDFNESSFVFTPFESISSPSPTFPRSPFSADGHDGLLTPPMVSSPTTFASDTGKSPEGFRYATHSTSFMLSPPSPSPEAQAEKSPESAVTAEFDADIFLIPSPSPSLALPLLTPSYLHPRTPPVPGSERPNLRLDEHIAALPSTRWSITCMAPSSHPEVEQTTSPASSTSSEAQSPLSSIFDSTPCYTPDARDCPRKLSSSTTASSATDELELEIKGMLLGKKGETRTPSTPADIEKEKVLIAPPTSIDAMERAASPKVNLPPSRKLRKPLPSPLRIDVPKRFGERTHESKVSVVSQAQVSSSSRHQASDSGSSLTSTRNSPVGSSTKARTVTVSSVPSIFKSGDKGKMKEPVVLFPGVTSSVSVPVIAAEAVGSSKKDKGKVRERSISLPQKASVPSSDPAPPLPTRVPGEPTRTSPSHVDKGRAATFLNGGQMNFRTERTRQPLLARRSRSNSISFLDLEVPTPTMEEYGVRPRLRGPLTAVDGIRPHTVFSALPSSVHAPTSAERTPKTPGGGALKRQLYTHFLKVLAGSGHPRQC